MANPCAWQHRTDFKHCLARDRLLCWKLFISNLFKWINLAVGAKKNSQRLCLWSISLSSPIDYRVSYTRRIFNQLWPNPQSHTSVQVIFYSNNIPFFYHQTYRWHILPPSQKGFRMSSISPARYRWIIYHTDQHPNVAGIHPKKKKKKHDTFKWTPGKVYSHIGNHVFLGGSMLVFRVAHPWKLI